MFIIKQLRRKKNLSQTDLAEVVGVSLRTIQLYEQKDANIPNKNLKKIAQFFDMDIAQLYSREVNEKNLLYGQEKMISKKGHSITKLAPGKYLLSVPLITRNEESQYVIDYENQKFISELIQVSFVVQQVSVANYMAFEITNNSMDIGELDGVPQGAIVLGKQVSKTEFKNKVKRQEDFNWIIVYDNTLMCKKITSYDAKTKTIICHSLNDSPEYPDFEIEVDGVKQFFMIVKKQVD